MNLTKKFFQLFLKQTREKQVGPVSLKRMSKTLSMLEVNLRPIDLYRSTLKHAFCKDAFRQKCGEIDSGSLLVLLFL